MHELTYYAIAAEKPDADEIKLMRKTSEKLHAMNGVTGCLFFHEEEFVGIFEGGKEAVKARYQKICERKEYRKSKVLAEGPISQRLFEGWKIIGCLRSEDPRAQLEYRLSVENMLSLAKFSEKPTAGSTWFWHTVEKILSEVSLAD